jgi:hypothetical protein
MVAVNHGAHKREPVLRVPNPRHFMPTKIGEREREPSMSYGSAGAAGRASGGAVQARRRGPSDAAPSRWTIFFSAHNPRSSDAAGRAPSPELKGRLRAVIDSLSSGTPRHVVRPTPDDARWSST